MSSTPQGSPIEGPQEIRVVVDGPVPERVYETYRYAKFEDGWYVDFGDGWERFALAPANNAMVRQLIRKERSCLY